MKKKKYLQIFNYLLEFSKLRSNPVRNIESSDAQYPEKIWLSDIPECDFFDCITSKTYNQESSYWIKINKPKVEPQPPIFTDLGNLLNDWVVKDSLLNENEIPILKDFIIKDNKEIFLIDTPQVKKEFQNYLDHKWLEDLKLYRIEFAVYESKHSEYILQSKTYKHFFSIYNKAQQFGEEFELCIGVGLLNFQENLDSPLICRHILTSKVEITFEEKTFAINVGPGIDAEIKIETESIIDLEEIFDPFNIVEAEKLIQKIILDDEETNLFQDSIKQALYGFSKRFHSDGDFKEDIVKCRNTVKNPTIYFAPALLLRKRNTKSFTALYEKIIDKITNSDISIDIPSINDIIGFPSSIELPLSTNELQNSINFSDQTIYFPKKHNDEQIEIIEKARRSNKVLVQGPPGTGKSHTIANLICHLLANGKKILVTAYTKRALEVLKNQLPEDFQNLTVNLLSGDSTSIQDLEASVNAINDKISSVTNLSAYKKIIEELEIELNNVKKDKAITTNEWIKVKEKAIRKQIINPKYQGTLSEIAEKIDNEHSIFSWFKDEFTDINRIEIKQQLERFISETKHYENIDCSIFDFTIPIKNKLFSLDEYIQYNKISNELSLKQSLNAVSPSIICNDFKELQSQLVSLHGLLLEIEQYVHPDKEKIKLDYANNLTLWKDKLAQTRNLLAELPKDKLKQFDRSIDIKYPVDKSLKQLKSDAEILLQLKKEGKRLRGILSIFNNPLTPIDIKQKLYFIKGVQVNGSDCDTVPELETVLEDIKIRQDFQELDTIWKIQHNGEMKCYVDKLYFYEQQKDGTEALISLIEQAYRIRKEIQATSSIKIKNYESEKISKLIAEVEYSFLIKQASAFKERILKVNNYLSIDNIHPIKKTISEAIQNINIDKYEEILIEIDKLNSEKEKFTAYKEQLQVAEKYFPILTNEIFLNIFQISHLAQFENAVYYKHACAEIARLLNNDYEEELTYKLSNLEKQEERLISEIASRKAWLSVLERLDNNLSMRQHLQAWVQAVRKIGKTGIGKRALKFRKEAQYQMEKCKDSVPCWIMPLYKVAETINPDQGMYDYVIIDEASQLGADAIFLLYISKNIIIVGDDKQTSPEYVGVDANTMTPHINRHLQDIPFANYYGTEFSFFDHAKRFCKGLTVLREHFRCMPEIIEFCNKHFYAPEGKSLYPLKQYSENRIAPIKQIFCANGYTEGNYQNIINKPEAEYVADKIAELISDENYVGKTFGVITLQGNKQAAVIDNLIIKKIGEVEYKKRNIICGNSASFQGDERDIMFLSLVTAHNHQRAPLVKPEDERRFNVAVSRAKEQVWLFHSVQLDDLSNTNDLRYKLLDHFLNYKQKSISVQGFVERTLGTQPPPFESWFEIDIYNDIIANNYNVIPQYEVAKGRYRIDLVAVLSNGVKIAIECDGDKYHGAEQFQNDLLRQKILERCGWQFFRVRGADYYSNRKKALLPLWKLLRANDI